MALAHTIQHGSYGPFLNVPRVFNIFFVYLPRSSRVSPGCDVQTETFCESFCSADRSFGLTFSTSHPRV